MRVVSILLFLLVTGCVATGPDSDISIGPPITVQQAEKEMEMEAHRTSSFENGRYEVWQEWKDFVSKITPGDELRSYMHPRGGKGYAIVRAGLVEDVYFWVIF
jgi:hypothetical protein